MAKRKRQPATDQGSVNGYHKTSVNEKPDAIPTARQSNSHFSSNGAARPAIPFTVQIVVGSYERVLHGFTATVQSLERSAELPPVAFSDTFLFNAHSSGIRCLALSPKSRESGKVILATGGSDQTVNLYALSTDAPRQASVISAEESALHRKKATQAQNKEIGTLQHHAGAVNALLFSSKSKLLTAANDNTIAVIRNKDWTILATIKVPMPKVSGYPSGKEASTGILASGINDFAVHPSMKLMISVGKGEKCMRLWNLVTGRKAAVLNFDRRLLEDLHEGTFNSGEAQRVIWNSNGEQFTVIFDRGCLVYGVDGQAKRLLSPVPRTKIHQARYVTLFPAKEQNLPAQWLLLSTEDGRILFYPSQVEENHGSSSLPRSRPVAQLGGSLNGSSSRIKDFAVMQVPDSSAMLIITGSSDGAVRLWSLNPMDATLHSAERSPSTKEAGIEGEEQAHEPRGIGALISTYETGSRITCLTSFVMSSTI